jgi:hypothetical protein
MGKRCVAANCNNTHKDGVSLFSFPKDAKVRASWKGQIRKSRADWYSPSLYSCICSKHFTEDCFESQSLLSGKLYLCLHDAQFVVSIDKFGLKRKKLLKPDAVPTIFTQAYEVKSLKLSRVSSPFRML